MMEEKKPTKIALFQKAPVIKKGDGKIQVGLFVSPTGTDDCAYCPLSPHSSLLPILLHSAPIDPYCPTLPLLIHSAPLILTAHTDPLCPYCSTLPH